MAVLLKIMSVPRVVWAALRSGLYLTGEHHSTVDEAGYIVDNWTPGPDLLVALPRPPPDPGAGAELRRLSDDRRQPPGFPTMRQPSPMRQPWATPRGDSCYSSGRLENRRAILQPLSEGPIWAGFRQCDVQTYRSHQSSIYLSPPPCTLGPVHPVDGESSAGPSDDGMFDPAGVGSHRALCVSTANGSHDVRRML